MNKRKIQDLSIFFSVLGIVVALNFISSRFFYRWDLTEDKRFTINEATVDMLEDLDDVVYVEVYLEGEFPSGFKRLQSSIKETLEEFKIYAGTHIQYAFINPSEGRSTKERNQFYQQLARKGLQPTNLTAMEGGGKTEKIIFPGAMVRYGSREIPVMLLKGNASLGPEQRLNQSVEGVEYELARAIKHATMEKQVRIAFIKGHGELDDAHSRDLRSTLSEYYEVVPVNLPTKVSLSGYDVALICDPTEKFTEPDKYKLDQFLLRGGKLLCFMDGVNMELDSIKPRGSLAMPNETNMTDFFFNYGLRINRDLVQDMYSAYIPLVTGYTGNTPSTEPRPWPYFPLINNYNTEHPTVKNLDATKAQFISSLDTVKAVGIRKTPLVFSSKNARVKPAPVRVNFNEVRGGLDPKMFRKSHIPLAYLMEGNFTSLYKNRLAPHTIEKFKPLNKGEKPGKLFVMADGDYVRNKVNPKSGEPYPLGYDRLAGFTFSNKDLVSNMVSYMLDEDGLILARTKEIMLRPLDKQAVQEQGLYYQILNMVLPLVLVVVLGLVKFSIRRYRYGRKK